MSPVPALLAHVSRMVTYPLAVAAARLVGVAQAVGAPFGAALPQWVAVSLLGYAVLATVMAIPPRAKPTASEDRVAVRPAWYAAIVVLDLAAASLVAWISGPSVLALLPGFDVAVIDTRGAFAVIALFGGSFGAASALRGAGIVPAVAQGLALGCGAYAVSAFAMLLRRSAERQIRAINHVLDAGSDLGTKLSMPEVLTQLLNMLKQFRESVPWQNVVVYVARYDTTAREELLCAEALAGSHADFYRGSKLRFTEGLVGYAASEQRPMIVADLQREQREANLPKPKAVRGALVVPIVSESTTIGCVLFTSAIVRAYTFDQQRLVDRLIRLASVGIQNARLHSKTLELADTDSMTGLLTNRAYQERLENEFRKAQQSRLSLALLIIDVDYFKHVNDTYCHPQGDELLRQLGEVIRQHARKDDVCCRYGGDEFTIVMPQTIKAEAAMVASRIRQAVEDRLFQLDAATAKITISVGVAGYPQDTATKPALVKAADDALYAAKQSGRNNVKLASRLLFGQTQGANGSTSTLRVPTPIDSVADPYMERPVR